MNQPHHHQTDARIGRRWVRFAAGALAASLSVGLASGTASPNTTSTVSSAGVVLPVQVTGQLVPTGANWLQQKGLDIQLPTINRPHATSGV